MRRSSTGKYAARKRRHARVRAKIYGTAKIPRLSLFRSNRYLWAQLIDDATGNTLVAVTDRELKKAQRSRKQDHAASAGALLAKKAKEAGIGRVRFDRGGFQYHGRIRVFAEEARKGGLEF